MFLDILVGIDGSPSSWRALDYGIELARAGNAKLTLITVAPPVSAYVTLAGVSNDKMRAELDRWAGEMLAKAAARVPADVIAHTTQHAGEAGPEIVNGDQPGQLRPDRPRLSRPRTRAGRPAWERERLRSPPRASTAPLRAGSRHGRSVRPGGVDARVRPAHRVHIGRPLVSERVDIPGGTASSPRSSSTAAKPFSSIQLDRPSSSTAACSGPWRSSAEAVITTSAPARRYLATSAEVSTPVVAASERSHPSVQERDPGARQPAPRPGWRARPAGRRRASRDRCRAAGSG